MNIHKTLLLCCIIITLLTGCSDYSPTDTGKDNVLKLSSLTEDSFRFVYYNYEAGLLNKVSDIRNSSSYLYQYFYEKGNLTKCVIQINKTTVGTLVRKYTNNAAGRISSESEYSQISPDSLYLYSEKIWLYDNYGKAVGSEMNSFLDNAKYVKEYIYDNRDNVVKIITKKNGADYDLETFEYDSCQNPYYGLYPFPSVEDGGTSKNNITKSVYRNYLDNTKIETIISYNYNKQYYPEKSIKIFRYYNSEGTYIETKSSFYYSY